MKAHEVDPDKEFWNWTVVFVSKDDNLTKAHVRWLVLVLAGLAGCATLDAGRGGLECTEPGRLACVPFAAEEVCTWDRTKGCQVCRCVNAHKEPDAPGRMPEH